jgi:thiamine kinase-like enzyme
MEEGLVYYRLTGKKAISMAPLSGGLSNRTLLINGAEVLRIKEPSDPHFYDPRLEKRIIEAVQPLKEAPRLLAYDESSGDMVSELVEASPFLGPDSSEEDLRKTLLLLDAMHGVAGDFRPFDLWGRYEYYEKESGAKPFLNEKRLRARVETMFAGEKMVLCHNDVVRGNVLKRNDGSLVLLDYEFAGMNYPEFDVASLLSENDLPAGLIDRIAPKSEEKIRLLMKVANRLWHYWAKWRERLTGLPIYGAIAELKLEAIEAEGK